MRYYFLDYLRIFAVANVFVGHLFANDLIPILESFSYILPQAILYFLEILIAPLLGVVIFFLVSGYIISHVLYQNTTAVFLIKRFFRIYPLYVVAVLMQHALFKMQNPNHEIIFSHLMIQLSLLGDFFQMPSGLGGVEWTLRVEIYFYLFMAIVQYYMPNRIYRTWFFSLLTGLVILFAIFTFMIFEGDIFSIFSTWPVIFMGCVFYLFEKKSISLYKLFLFMLLIFVFYQYSVSKELDEIYEISSSAFLGIGIFAFAWKFQKTFPTNNLILIISNLTYAIYLFHNWLFNYFDEKMGSTWIALVLFTITCYCAHIIIEKPFWKLGKNLAIKMPSLSIKKLTTSND